MFVLDFDGVIIDSEREVRELGALVCDTVTAHHIQCHGTEPPQSTPDGHHMPSCRPMSPPHPAQVSSSAYDAAAQLWPQLFGGLPDAERQRVMAGMRATRPRLVKGFEAMVRPCDSRSVFV